MSSQMRCKSCQQDAGHLPPSCWRQEVRVEAPSGFSLSPIRRQRALGGLHIIHVIQEVVVVCLIVREAKQRVRRTPESEQTCASALV
jgi:hypothetical protein